MDHHDIARRALDCALQCDRALRGIEADLSGMAGLAEVLDADWRDGLAGDLGDLMSLVPWRDMGLTAVDQLGEALSARWAILRRAAAGDAGALRPALDECLGLHRAMLAMTMRGFGPRGLAA